MEIHANFVFFTKMLIIIWSRQRNGNISKQIFENLNYVNKNIVSVYFTREKAEKIGKNEMYKFNARNKVLILNYTFRYTKKLWLNRSDIPCQVN
jgi:hypothetical protein